MNIRIAFLLFLFFCFSNTFAQSGSQSPYSRYGLGDNQFGGFVPQLAMGGFSIAHFDTLNLNVSNAASYSTLKFTLIEAAVRADYTISQIIGSKSDNNNGGLGYVAIGFPVIYKKWGSSFGVIPFTSTGYNLITYGKISDTVIYANNYKGNGGLNRFYWGNGFRISKNIAAGFNASYLFGTIEKSRNTEFTESGYYNSLYNVSSSYSIFNIDFGGRFKTDSLFFIRKKGFERYYYRDSVTTNGDTIKIKEDRLPDELSSMQKKKVKASRWLRLNVGLTGTYSTPTTEKDKIISTTYKNFSGIPVAKDTLLYIPQLLNDVNMPSYIGAGVSLQDYNHWLVGIDATFQQWSKFAQSDITDSLKNSYKISVGGEYIPKYNSVHFLERVAYRAGFRYNKTQLDLRNTRINEYAFTFGFGIPIRKDNVTAAFGTYYSRINLSIEIGKRGTTANNLLQENYFRVNLGLNIAEQWFIKRKYD